MFTYKTDAPAHCCTVQVSAQKVQFHGNTAELLSFLTLRLTEAGLPARLTPHSGGVLVTVDTSENAWRVAEVTSPSFEAA